MKIECNKTVQVRLAMTEEEARWLMSYVQNPMCAPDEESKEDSRMRELFFKSIQNSLNG